MAVAASDNRLGAVLFQVIDGLEHPICYLSRELRSSELNYATIEKEALTSRYDRPRFLGVLRIHDGDCLY